MATSRSQKAPFIGKRIVVFTAHPDDEGLAAGTMYENHKAGGETVLICATNGEKGKSHLAKPVTDSALKKIRRNELMKAAKILKIDKVIFLGFPDASVRAHKRKLFEKSLAVIRKIKPDYILGFGPDGISAHWDHITVGEVALGIAKKTYTPMAAFTLADIFVEQPRVAEKRQEFFLKRRRFGAYKGMPVHRKGDLRVKIDLARKRKAMSVHKSQFLNPAGPYAHLSTRLQKQAMGYEHFVKESI